MIPRYKVDMYQGADWRPKLNWYGGGLFMGPIEEIDPGYPTKIRVTAHGLPSASDTPVIISGVEGMTILNSKELAILQASRVDADYFTMPISTVACEWVVGTGEITYYKPTDISAYTAFRGKLRSRVYKSDTLADMTEANGKIIITDNDAGIELNLTAAETALLDFTHGYVDVEGVDAGDQVHRIFALDINFIRESTR